MKDRPSYYRYGGVAVRYWRGELVAMLGMSAHLLPPLPKRLRRRVRESAEQ